MQVDSIKPVLKPPGTILLKLSRDGPLSKVAFKFNLRRHKLVSSARRVLLKALMRALALTNFAPGAGHTAAAGLEATAGQETAGAPLCGALILIFQNPRLFGSGVFSLAANLLSDVMNHEPTCYHKLEACGVPKVGRCRLTLSNPS